MINPLSRKLSESQTAICNIISSGIVGLISILAVPIFTRILDQSSYGLTGIYSAWVQIFSTFIGLQVGGSIGSAYANLEEDEQDSYQLSVLSLATLSFLITAAASLAALKSLAAMLNMPQPMVVCAIIQSFGACIIGVFNKRYIFKKQAQANLILSITVSLLSTASSIALVLFNPIGVASSTAWAMGYSLPAILIGIFVAISLAIKTHAKIEVRYWSFCLRITLPIILHGLAGVALAQLGLLSVQHILGDAAAGIYSIAITVSTILSALYSALNNAFVPFMYDDLAGKTSKSVTLSHFRNYFILFTFVSCIYIICSPEIVKALAPSDYWEASKYSAFLIIGVYFTFLYSFPVNFEFFKMKTASIGIGTMLAAIIDLILVVSLTPKWGMLGASASTMISYFFLFLFHYLFARCRLGDKNYPASYYVIGTIAVLLSSSVLFIFGSCLIVRYAVSAALFLILLRRLWRIRTIF